jgi:DNA-directed RNA polymerase specialized sigma24 family protein
MGFVRGAVNGRSAFQLSSHAPIPNVALRFDSARWTPRMILKKQHLIHELFTRNKRDLFNYFARRVGREDASDLLQETFVRALRYEGLQTVADPPAFLQQIAINLTRDFGRRRKIESSLLEYGRLPAEAPSGEAPPEEKIEFERQ